MILLPRAVHVYVAVEPCNLRKSFNGLSNEVRVALSRNPLSGHFFVFVNRRKNQAKLLAWTRGGFTIDHKKLETGTFVFGQQLRADATCVEIDVHELAMLLEGIDVTTTRQSKRWEPPLQDRKHRQMTSNTDALEREQKI